ncbi:MAG TPA: hypothetical protein VK469_06725 [Candidatus Kapabacteria bacterium]|nr:hypothetical protein [Candidatus Kapabacteria bacterium]
MWFVPDEEPDGLFVTHPGKNVNRERNPKPPLIIVGQISVGADLRVCPLIIAFIGVIRKEGTTFIRPNGYYQKGLFSLLVKCTGQGEKDDGAERKKVKA